MTEPQRTARINEQLAQYWHELRSDRTLPFEHEISSDALSDIWENCYLVTASPKGFAYDYMGNNLLAAYGDGMLGREVSEMLIYPHPESLLTKFRTVCMSGVPAMDEGEFTNSRGQKIKYRSSVLPFTARGRSDVAFLLGGMRWKTFDGGAA